MTITHLTDEELDLALIGADLPADAAAHLASCVACRRRRDAFLSAVEGGRGADPDEAARERVRERALEAWSGVRAPRRWKRWLAAAAAVVLLGLLPVLRSELAGRPKVDTEAVLVEVDDVLARDPLAAVAPAEVVEAVAPVPDLGDEGGLS